MGTAFKNGSTLLTGGSDLPAEIVAQANKGTSATSSVAVAYPGATTSGNILAASVYTDANATGLPDISGWTAKTAGINSNADSMGLFYKVADGTETTITATSTGAGAMELHIYELQNVKNPVLVDVTPTSNGNATATGTTQVTPSITTRNSRSVVFATCGLSANVTSPSISTMTLRQTSNRLLDAIYVPDALLTSFTDTFSWTTAARRSSIIMALEPTATMSPALTITFNSSAPAAQFAFEIFDYLAAPVWATGNSSNKVSQVFGDKVRAINTSGSIVGAGFYGRFSDAQPAGMVFSANKTTVLGPRVFSGSGAPAVNTAKAGDIWIRTDTPGTASQMVYQCTTAGNPGTWTARL